MYIYSTIHNQMYYILKQLHLCSGLGGGFGYIVGGVNWDNTEFGKSMGGQLRVIYLFTCITLIIMTTLTLTSIPERPLLQSQNKSSKHLKSPIIPLPASPPPPPGAPQEDDEEVGGLYSYQFSNERYPDCLGHSSSANARLCAGLNSPISPLSPLTPKYGSFISRDNTLTNINEFASSLGTSYIDSVLIDCYTGHQMPKLLEPESVAPPIPMLDTPLTQMSQPISAACGGSQIGESSQTNGDLPGTERLEATQDIPAIEHLEQSEISELSEPPQDGSGIRRGCSTSGILKRPQSLALINEPLIYPSNGLENGRRRTVTFSQQVSFLLTCLHLF